MTYEYRIIEGRAPLAPAECILTGSKSDPLIDTGKTIRFYGRVYISAREFAIIAHQFGFLSPSQAQDLQDEHEALAAANTLALEENEELRDALDSGLAGLRSALLAGARTGDAGRSPAGEADGGPSDERPGDGALADGERIGDDDEPAGLEGHGSLHPRAGDDALPDDPADA